MNTTKPDQYRLIPSLFMLSVLIGCMAIMPLFVKATPNIAAKSGVSSEISVLVITDPNTCSHCRDMIPELAIVKQALRGTGIRYTETAPTPALIAKYNVPGIPTVIISKSGREVIRFVGFTSAKQILKYLPTQANINRSAKMEGSRKYWNLFPRITKPENGPRLKGHAAAPACAPAPSVRPHTHPKPKSHYKPKHKKPHFVKPKTKRPHYTKPNHPKRPYYTNTKPAPEAVPNTDEPQELVDPSQPEDSQVTSTSPGNETPVARAITRLGKTLGGYITYLIQLLIMGYEFLNSGIPGNGYG